MKALYTLAIVTLISVSSFARFEAKDTSSNDSPTLVASSVPTVETCPYKAEAELLAHTNGTADTKSTEGFRPIRGSGKN